MAKSAIKAEQLLEQELGDSDFLKTKLVTAKFYTEHFLVRTKACIASIEAGSDAIKSLSEEQFFSHVN